MCGIAGLYAYHHAAPDVNREELCCISAHMVSRGPDGSGEWFSTDGRVGFAHRRLAIIDLMERAAQPMQSADGALVVTYNGEIYNYQALRKDLESKGRAFRTHSDTEVLLHLYAETGVAMVHELRGMFAFALWDAHKCGVLLARDPYGIKPLYYADDGRTLRFASQVKALVAGGKISRDTDPAGLVGFYLFGSVPEPYTTYQEIRGIPAGATLWVDEIGRREAKRYFSISKAYCEAETNPDRSNGEVLQQHVREALTDSVRHHLVADVPVGAFLSAGVDSGALVGLMRDAGQQDIQTITLAFEEFRGKPDDEAPIAERVAAHYRTRHSTRIVTANEFREDLPKILEAMDQPSIDGINSWFVSKATRELGLKVAISGLGGDELFGGYPSFRDIPLWVRLFGAPTRIPWLGQALRRAASALLKLSIPLSPKTPGLIEYGGTYPGAYLLQRGLFMPWELPQLIDTDLAVEGLRRLRPLEHIPAALAPDPRTPLARVATLESALYLRKQLLRDADWTGMAHSLEIRVPLVDAYLLERFAPLLVIRPEQSKKKLLGLSPTSPLPKESIQRAKTGFQTPISLWLTKLPPNGGIEARIGQSACRAHWSRLWATRVIQSWAPV